MSSVNRKSIGGHTWKLDSAAEFTQLIRWLNESRVQPAPVHSIISVPLAGSLLSIANLIQLEQLNSRPIPCSTALLYGGAAPTTDFSRTLDGENVTFAGDFILEDGGTPSSIFC